MNLQRPADSTRQPAHSPQWAGEVQVQPETPIPVPASEAPPSQAQMMQITLQSLAQKTSVAIVNWQNVCDVLVQILATMHSHPGVEDPPSPLEWPNPPVPSEEHGAIPLWESVITHERFRLEELGHHMDAVRSWLAAWMQMCLGTTPAWRKRGGDQPAHDALERAFTALGEITVATHLAGIMQMDGQEPAPTEVQMARAQGPTEPAPVAQPAPTVEPPPES